MNSGMLLNLKPAARLLEEAGQPVGLEEPGLRRLRLPGIGTAPQALLRALGLGQSTEDELCGGATGPDALELRYLLARLEQDGWIGYTLAQGSRPLAVLEPLTRAFRFQPAVGEGPWRLSRFAWLRRREGQAVLESPLGFARVRLWEPSLLEWAGRLCRPQDAASLAAGSGLEPDRARAFLSMLVSAGAVAPCDGDGALPEDRDPALRQWEFHDLLFHSRSREGRHGDPVGGTLRFLGDLEPLPALKPTRPGAGIPLPEPSNPAPAPAFFSVLEARRSIRSPGQSPVTLDQLGSFLHHVARIRQVLPADPDAGRVYEAVSGPCPGGGGLHEIELYLSVGRCAGLEPGFYHYDPAGHRLEPWSGSQAASERLLRQAQAAMGSAGTGPAPDILITLAARMQRVAWKYQSIAYALILKNTGVLYQQMYLVATALGLAPCAIGAGDTQLFAQASGLDFLRESSVGEFALSG
jgi:SagB-type dehydrogenase family enzyme